MIGGCGFSEYTEKERGREKAVITLVQNSESTYPGVTTTKAIAGLLGVLEHRGRYIKIVGWSSVKNLKDSSYDVWLTVEVNDEPSKFHWVVKDNQVMPVNDLAQSVTRRI